METIRGKEGKGAKGTGFNGAGGSSKIAHLPKASNSELGIDATVAMGGVMRPKSNLKTSKEMNSGASVNKSSNKGVGIDADIAAGGVRRSAKANGGMPRASLSENYGGGSRFEGVAGDTNVSIAKRALGKKR